MFCSSVFTGGGELGSKCRPRKESSRLQMSPLPKNMTPVTNQNARGSYTHTSKMSPLSSKKQLLL